MAAPMELFSFPPDFDILSLPHQDNKLCVVSIIGKSRQNGFSSKASVLNPVLDKDVFMGISEGINDAVAKGDVECYFDADLRVVYLHNRSLNDIHRLALTCQRLIKESASQDFFSLWQKEEYRQAKTLLWMFHISHIIMLSHAGSSFDISFVRLFRNLDVIRAKLQHCITDQLHGLPISKDWFHSGRPCSPRVLFLFESSSFEEFADDNDSGAISKTKKSSPIKKLQHAMEDQIYRILRKSRVITNISNNSLFAVPANQEFVYIHGKKTEVTDPVTYYLDQLRLNSTVIKDSDSPRSRGYQVESKSSQSNIGSGEGSRSSSVLSRSSGIQGFKEFLWQHIEMALGRGFDDNVGRNPVPPIFEQTTVQNWFLVAVKLYDFFFGELVNSKAQAHLNTLKSLLETDIRFSENRCNKVLPVAEGAYQEGLPTHYVTNFHLTKLAQAQRVFHQFARGPACDKYLRQLEQACEKFWKNGRQLCEEISITGNHCVNPLHRLPDEIEMEENAHLPIMPHSSQMKIKAACNCGRKQADKDDPFDHKYANFDFYDSLDKTCCHKLDHIKLPVFKPSTTEVRAGSVLTVPRFDVDGNKCSQKDSAKQDIVGGMASLSLALSLGQSGGSDFMTHQHTSGISLTTDHQTDHHSDHDNLHKENESEHSPGHAKTTSNNSPDHVHEHIIVSPDHDHEQNTEGSEHVVHSSDTDHEEHEIDDTVEEEVNKPRAVTVDKIIEQSSAVRQHSTTEYLLGMIHSDSPPDLLPKFPSWSVCCLGKGSQYNHTAGLDLPGFLHGSNFLLPWDIKVKAEKDKWPSIGEMTSRKGKQKKSSKDVSELNLRIFLGDEYECPRGHRFFCSGPEKVIKVSSTSTVKDNANKLVTLDMPLYCACPHCRSTKGYIAQLMRLFIVTPEGPVKVTINPLIQPSIAPCPFFSLGTDGPLELDAGGLWSVRLPHIYLGDHGAYTMPTDPQQIGQCRMLKGVFGYKEVHHDS